MFLQQSLLGHQLETLIFDCSAIEGKNADFKMSDSTTCFAKVYLSTPPVESLQRVGAVIEHIQAWS